MAAGEQPIFRQQARCGTCDFGGGDDVQADTALPEGRRVVPRECRYIVIGDDVEIRVGGIDRLRDAVQRHDGGA